MANVIKGTNIPEEWFTKVRKDVILSARKQSIARKLTKVNSLGNSLGILSYQYDKMSEVSDATLTWQLTEAGEDVIGISRAHKEIPVIHKEFKIDFRDLEAARLGGYPIDSHTAGSAAYKVMNLENAMIINGYTADGTNYDVKGLYQSAGNTYSASDFGTPGNAIDAVSNAVDKLMADLIYPPYNMVLNPTQYIELSISILGKTYDGSSTTAAQNGAMEMPIVEKLLGGGQIFVTPFQTAATGMVLSTPGAGHHEVGIAKDVSIDMEIEAKTQNLWGRVYEAVVPIIYDANSICTLTTI